MNFSQAWAKVAKENFSLRVALFVLGVCTLFFSFATVTLALKDPIVFERACYTKKLDVAEPKQTQEEILSFLEMALLQRFETKKPVIEGFLSVREQKNKDKEQKKLEANSIEQTVRLKESKFEDDIIIAKLDRTYSVGEVRSTLPLTVSLKVETKARTATNPYGLILVETKEIKRSQKDEK